MHATETPLTVAGDIVVIGPTAGPQSRHTELVRRTVQWQCAPDPWGMPGDVSPAAGSPDAAIRQATHHVRRSTSDTAAVVRPMDGRIHYVRLVGDGRVRWSGIRTLADVTAQPVDGGVPADVILRLTDSWSGLFTPAVVTDVIPGHGLVAAQVQVIGPGPQHSVGWGGGADAAVAHALLGGIRLLATRSAPVVADGRLLVGAAGRSELHWLLDGVLRLVSTYAIEVDDREQRDDLEVVTCRVPHLAGEWRIGRVAEGCSATVVTAAWGRTAAESVRHAVAAARVRRSPPGSNVPAGTGLASTDALLHQLGPRDLARLRDDLQTCAARLGFRALGARIAADALLGNPGVAGGMVWQA